MSPEFRLAAMLGKLTLAEPATSDIPATDVKMKVHQLETRPAVQLVP